MAEASTPPELPPELVRDYLIGMRAVIEQLVAIADRLSAAGHDREALAQLQGETHKIHGSAGSFGFPVASRLAAGMEVTAKDWVSHPDDRDVDRGSLTHWFVTRLAEMLKLEVPLRGTPRPGSAGPPEMPRQALPRLILRRPGAARPEAPTAPPQPKRRVDAARAPSPSPPAQPAPPVPSPPPPPPPPRPAPPKRASPPAAPPTEQELPWLVSPADEAQPPAAAAPPAAPTRPETAEPPQQAAAPAAASGEVPEVILVEDDPALAELLEFGLRARGYRFLSYRHGRDALRDLRALDVGGTRPLVLLDVDLPGLDGYSVLDALERDRPGVYRVVFTTVHGTETEQLRGLEAGALDYLVKPISLRVALEKIRRWVGK